MAVYICKTCGARLPVPDGQGEFVCEYCGTRQTVSGKIRRDDPTTLPRLLERGKIALEDCEWARARLIFEKALELDPHSAEAFWGRFLADEKLNEQMCLDGSFAERYETDETEIFHARAFDRDHVEESVRKYAIPYFLNEEEIRSQYAFNDVFYSDADIKRKQRDSLNAGISTDRSLARALEFAGEGTKQRIESCLNAMSAVMEKRLADAEAARVAAIASVKKSYRDFLGQADRKVSQMHADAQNRREALYRKCLEEMKRPHTRSEWILLHTRLERLGNYKNAPELVRKIRRKIETEEKRRLRREKTDRFFRNIGPFLRKYWILPVLLVICVSCLNRNSQKLAEYNRAEALLADGRTKEAIAVFKKLGGYKDSRRRAGDLEDDLSKNAYQEALLLMASEEYEEAAAIFSSLGGYENSREFLEQCLAVNTERQYQDAAALMLAGQYPEAIAVFQKLDGYKDSAEQIKACERLYGYANALNAMEEKNYAVAYAGFDAQDDFRDSAELKDRCAALLADRLGEMDVQSAAEEMTLLDQAVFSAAAEKIPDQIWSDWLCEQGTETAAALLDRAPARKILSILKMAGPDEADGILNSLSRLTKYRLGLVNAEPGSSVLFGSFEQDNDAENGPEPIEWLVLENDGSRILLLSRYALAADYYAEYANTRDNNKQWKQSRPRAWLNQTFLQEAFSDEEAARIGLYKVAGEKGVSFRSGIYEADPENDVKDRIFLLSASEVTRYLPDEGSRQCAATPFLKSQGKTELRADALTEWWLRTAGTGLNDEMYVYADGRVNEWGTRVRKQDPFYIAVRPALWFDL